MSSPSFRLATWAHIDCSGIFISSKIKVSSHISRVKRVFVCAIQLSSCASLADVDRVHDGPVRLEDAPPISFGYVPTADNALHTLTFHSVFAEPGELTSIMALDLNTFVRNAGEYRMFFAAAVRSDSSRSAWRVTVLFFRTANSPITMGKLGVHRPGNMSDIEWAEKHLIELDPLDNPLFYAEPGRHQWHVATRFHPTGDGVSGPLSLVVGVARGLSLRNDESDGAANLSALAPCWIDGSKVARVH